LSTNASQLDLSPSWKQEVNRRLAAHRCRKGSSAVEPEAHLQVKSSASNRAAAAVARVAARYAKAPSYSEILAGEARAVVRAAEAATRSALEAQAAAESLFAGIEAASSAGLEWVPEVSAGAVQQQECGLSYDPVLPGVAGSSRTSQWQPIGIASESNALAREAEPEFSRATHVPDRLEPDLESWWEPASSADHVLDSAGLGAVEAAEPIHANLIQFPRELVATRKARPRLAEVPSSSVVEPEMQLSIFEVDPGAIAIQTVVASAAAVSAPAWPLPEWSDIELDAHPREEFLEEPTPEAATASALQPASMSLRLMAGVVDAALIAGTLLAAAMVALNNTQDLPSLMEIESSGAVSLVVIAALYLVFFFTLGRRTPGMMYAHVSLCTFKDESPTRVQRWSRLGALLLSLLPVGLGLVWAVFDNQHLTWHDRLSRTYLRRS
jgi:uncharacterized RDD family membrane protein YckC